ncbi:HD domain-containing protein [Actinacidiphila sp. ITFR-21]|uniref:HD domain-containing protein n=1 Tax=Actinacidiphila sp. ITFR-21 TaxID=3075199 RepID=UPI00288BA2F7|nr:caspase family protein [Streptomyces sp. ITFR-21]WNI16013.1 caspase family protein [Streptomyces sp. ITFR-21]
MSHQALLIGASDYDDPAIAELPFIPDDLRRLQNALTEREFGSVEILESPRGTTGTAVHARVSRFLREAARGDVLFILLSGHGQHFEGADYLIPEDASFAIDPFASCCVEIGWRKELEESAAAQVVFLIDACREGLEQDAKSPAGVHRWATKKVAATLRRKVAYVYACSPAEKAHFIRATDTAHATGTDGGAQASGATGEARRRRAADGADGATTQGDRTGESFSLFSRAVADVVTEVTHAVDLADFEEQVQARVSALHTAYGKPGRPQRLRVTTDVGDRRAFAVLPGPARHARAHPWVRSVTVHPAWDRTAAGPTRDMLQQVCAALAGQLADDFTRSSAVLRDDPWHDTELARRAQSRMDFLVRRVEDTEALSRGGRPAAFSPTEAALTVLLPLVVQAFWTHEAAQRVDVLDKGARTPEHDRFHDFVRTHPRLVRRLRTLDQAGDPRGDTARIRWWLFHRWLLQQPELYTGQSLKSLLGTAEQAPDGDCDRPAWVDVALSADRFGRFVQDLRTAPFGIPGDSALAVPDVIGASTGDEHDVRHALVAALAKSAQALAVDPVDLPEIVVEHLGISDAVDLPELLTTLRASEWRTSGVGRSLHAVCHHPAVQIALRDHARRTDELLRDVNRNPALPPLRSLPPFADADQVRLSGSTPEHLSDGIRFQLAEDRVQELLMGESLYQDRGLAVRELYQNALDALRYRDARTQYLRRTGDGRRREDTWTGRIDFRQGLDADGRPYLECRDNGIGMGVHELSHVFAQGGTRFVDLPEYIGEEASWSELSPPITLHPNSRFGIGVLSYFMLADEIEVRTCRMGRDGRPGRLLKVTIAGPGNLFRVQDLGEGEETGTSVRLMLARGRSPVSCVDTLEQLLWVAQYRTTAEHGSRRAQWAPGELAAAAVERHRSSQRGRLWTSEDTVLPSGCPDLWWIDGAGALLADGLYVSSSSADREAPYGLAVNLYGPHRPELTVNRASALSYDYAYVERAALATAGDVVLGQHPLSPHWLDDVSESSPRIADRIADLAGAAGLPWEVGGHPTTFDAVGVFAPDELLVLLMTGGVRERDRAFAALVLRRIPAQLLRWRLAALYGTGMAGPFAGPQAGPRPCARPSDLALLNSAASGLQWRETLSSWLLGPVPDRAAANELALLTRWRSPEETVSANTLMGCAESSGHTPGDVADRCAQLGYRTEPLGGLAKADRTDLPLLTPLGDASGWLPPGAELSAAQVAFSAALANLPTREAAERLGELGFTLPGAVPCRERWTSEEREMLRGLWRAHAEPPAPGAAMTVTVPQLVQAAQIPGLPLREAAELLTGLGFHVPPAGSLVEEATDDDRMLLAYEGVWAWADRPVAPIHVLAVASRTRRPAAEVVGRLRALGFQAADIPTDREPDLAAATDKIVKDGLYSPVARVVDGIVELHNRHTFTGVATPTEGLAGALEALGYVLAGGPQLMARRIGADGPAFGTLPTPSGFGPVPPVDLYALGEYVGRPRPEVAAELASLGYEIAPEDPRFEGDLQVEWTLGRLIRRFHPALGGTPATPPPRDPQHISLPALAATAMRHGLPFHEAARFATACAIHHEAEPWFPPAPAPPATG